MANYLPVLLVSLSTNAIPDDSSLTTLPRGQVDYLSHDWQEEDVWRSWRNMTRQKNEIANGVRLENASWRTWWKQRNKLKTVSPETLNWLKDSDVTWLYGPLHTAVDWTPPPKPKPDDLEPPEISAHDRLDLSIPLNLPKHKPILKHRSISELLTSELPNSPIFSPVESDEDEQSTTTSIMHQLTVEQTLRPSRPLLTHTKSDTHISRWGPSRLLRKDSPPRIDPPGHSPASTRVNGSSPVPAEPTSTANIGPIPKRKHISFNTYVEQCIAIEKPKKSLAQALRGGVRLGNQKWDNNTDSLKWDVDDGYEEDEEDGGSVEDEEDGIWETHYPTGSAVESDSESSCDDDDEDDEEDGVIEMRSANKRSQSKISSSSSSSNSTSNSSESPPRTRRRKHPPIVRRDSLLIYAPPSTTSLSTQPPVPPTQIPQPDHRSPPPLQRALSTSSEKEHVTIAPIPPTILKTSGVGDGFGWGGDARGWIEGFGDDIGGSDDNFSYSAASSNTSVPTSVSGNGRWWNGSAGANTTLDEDRETIVMNTGSLSDRSSGGTTPVELVYVPFGNGFNGRTGWDQQISDLDGSTPLMMDDFSGRPIPRHPTSPQSEYPPSIPRNTSVSSSLNNAVPISVPVVVVPASDASGGAYDYFGGPDLGEDFDTRGRGRGRRALGSGGLSNSSGSGERSVSRGRAASLVNDNPKDQTSRSRSRSRTPSPALLVGAASASSSPAVSASPTAKSRTDSLSPPVVVGSASSALLSLPSRGRGSSASQHLQQQESSSQSRGRSVRRSGSASSLSERDRSRSGGSSPLGSLSPDGSGVVAVAGSYGVYANGRVDKEKEREKGKRGSGVGNGGSAGDRGRDRTGKRLIHASEAVNVVPREALTGSDVGKQKAVGQSPPVVEESVKGGDEDEQPRQQPTPSNSPVISMQAPDAHHQSRPTPQPSETVESALSSHPISVALPPSPTPAFPTSPRLSSPPTSPTRSASSRQPLALSPPHKSSPSTSYSKHEVPASPTSPSSLHSRSFAERVKNVVADGSTPAVNGAHQHPNGTSEPTIVGKAVGMVSSAGAYLGFWHGGG